MGIVPQSLWLRFEVSGASDPSSEGGEHALGISWIDDLASLVDWVLIIPPQSFWLRFEASGALDPSSEGGEHALGISWIDDLASLVDRGYWTWLNKAQHGLMK